MNMKKIAAALLLCTAAGTAGAVGRIMDVTVYDRTEGRTLPVYRHGGRHYVVGKPGNEYRIRVQNRSGGDLLTVMSVDGINAITGETANWGQSGYVLAPGQGYDVRGWRKSLERTAAFYFTEHQNSYASRTGRPHNVGVIGVAVFRRKAEPEARIEQAPGEQPYPAERDDSPFPTDEYSSAYGSGAAGARSAPGADSYRESAPRKRPSLGTGHGRIETSRASYTRFERASPNPEEVVVIHYDTHANLVAMGVIRAPRLASPAPAPFPGQFVPDPRW